MYIHVHIYNARKFNSVNCHNALMHVCCNTLMHVSWDAADPHTWSQKGVEPSWRLAAYPTVHRSAEGM